MARKVLFLCTGNSCRSQIAEAIVNALYPNWRAYSAGTRPAGYIHPMAIRVLREVGIQHTGVSKNVELFRNDNFDIVITVCDDANEECPVWLGSGVRIHQSFSDPAKAEGSEEDRLRVFREVRDAMTAKIPKLLK